MAKKKKGLEESPFEAVLADEANVKAEIAKEEKNEQQSIETAEDVRPPSMKKRDFTAEELEKLDKFDVQTETCNRLLNENDELRDRLAQYIEENESLKNDNSKFLMKISELTFDLAKITSEFDALKCAKQPQYASKQVQQNVQTNPSKQVPYQYPRQNNGYSDWN